MIQVGIFSGEWVTYGMRPVVLRVEGVDIEHLLEHSV